MKILGVDPGKTTGLALIEIVDRVPHIRWMDESRDVTGLDYKDKIQLVDVVVMENFLVRPNKAKRGAFDWSDMVAPRVIGAVTSLAAQFDTKLVIQEPSIKPVGYGYSNLNYVKGKQGQHVSDAVAHAVYYGVKQRLCLPVKPPTP